MKTEYGKAFTLYTIDVAAEMEQVEEDALGYKEMGSRMAFKAGTYQANYMFAAQKYNELVEALTPSMREELQK